MKRCSEFWGIFVFFLLEGKMTVISVTSYLNIVEHKAKLLSGQKVKICFMGSVGIENQGIEKELKTEIRKLLTPGILQI